jgi:hypothetical protein
MHLTRIARLTPAPLAVAAALAAAPAPAAASDASFKAAVIPKVQKLAIAELRVSTAANKLSTRGSAAVPKVRRRVHAASHEALVVERAARRHDPSSRTGRHARSVLLRALELERHAYAELDAALRAGAHDHAARAKRLLARASSEIAKSRRLGVRAGKLIRGL